MSSVDIVVPCYNYGRYLRCCLRSILEQSGVNVRVLIIDDASTDDSAAIGRALAGEDSRVTFLRHLTNRGNISTYNEGIDWVSSDYFLLLSADDWLLPGALARAVKILEGHPEVVLVHGRAAVARVGQPDPQIEDSAECEYSVVSGQSFIEAACANSDNNPVWTPTAMVRSADQKAVGGYSIELPHAGDLHLWLTLACRGSIAKIENYQAVYRTHDANMHYSYSKLKNLRQHLLAFDSVFESCPQQIANRIALKHEYRKHLALSAIRLAQRDLIDGQPETCHEYISFAFELAPDIRGSSAWLQLRLLQLGGHRIASFVKSIARHSARKARTLRRAPRANSLLSSVRE